MCRKMSRPRKRFDLNVSGGDKSEVNSSEQDDSQDEDFNEVLECDKGDDDLVQTVQPQMSTTTKRKRGRPKVSSLF